jgi:uncharacterized protein YceH (UPF0502 family)
MSLDSTWPVLSVGERRILGVLVEKAKTTPEAYPLSVNALTTGSNQKSNRDPLMNLTEEDVEELLASCQQKGLVTKITGGRVPRWRHNLYEQWQMDKVEAAIITELLLRGPQTEGELRSRAARMEPIDDLEALRQKLGPLEERKLVVYLGPKERRGAQLTHGFHSPAELETLRTGIGAESGSAPAHVSTPRVAVETDNGVAELRAEHRQLQTQLAQIQEDVAQLREQLRSLKAALGVS